VKRLRRILQGACLLLGLLAVAAGLRIMARAQAVNPHAPNAPLVDRIVLDDTIQPMSLEIVSRALHTAAQDHAAALIIELNTPGGLLEATRSMVQQINESSVPVIVYIAPTGARGASAGFFILEAADVAAMAPGTNTGAAHPVLEGQTMDPVMKEKIENDAAAFLRSYSSRRGRNASLAESAVRESKAFSDQEALDQHLIDVIAKNDDDLLTQLNGRTITRFDGSTQTLHFAGYKIATLQPTLRQTILDKLMKPDLALFILVLGGLLIYLEFHVPGTIVPGATGTLLVLLALFALNLLPIHYTSAALLVAGLLLLVAEAKFPSHGLLSLVGTAALVFGMVTLVDGPVPQLRVTLMTAVAAGVAFGGITFFIAGAAMRAKRNKVKTGMAALMGEIAETQTPLQPSGQVMVRGELWNAHSTCEVGKGEAVVVTGFHGLTLEVEPRS
jgi:membrane-bound serine protease (ClpP class)